MPNDDVIECEPILTRTDDGIALTCHPWSAEWPDDEYPEGVTLADVSAAVEAHALEHPRAVVRRERNPRPKFRKGLGIHEGAKIITEPASG